MPATFEPGLQALDSAGDEHPRSCRGQPAGPEPPESAAGGDAHRHLWPLSDWRFASPVSYWDPAHHGQWASLAEIALVAVGSVWLWRRHPERGPRWLVAALALVYLLYWGFVAVVWM